MPTPPLLRLPWRLDPALVAAASEVLDCAERVEWVDEPATGLGTAAIPLVSVGGTVSRDLALAGPLRPTAALEQRPALRRLLAAVGAPVGRCRLLRLPARREAPAVVQTSHHWSRRVALCIPLAAAPSVALAAGHAVARLRTGEAWRVDVTRRHRLRNPSSRPCVLLLAELRTDAVATGEGTALVLEPHRFEVLEPHELHALLERIRHEPELRPMTAAARAELDAALERVEARWSLAFARFGHDAAGELAYQDAVLELREHVLPRLRPGTPGMRAAALIDSVLAVCPPAARRLQRPAASRTPTESSDEHPPPSFERPVIVVSPPRSGSTLLFELLRRFPEVWSIGGESHELIRAIPSLHPAAHGWSSDRLDAVDASAPVAAALRASFAARLCDRDGRRHAELPAHARPAAVRLLEKTPANALRIPFLRAVFPGAVFVHLVREPRETIGSLVEGWRSRRFLAYRDLPGWPYRDWSFLLPPGWQAMAGRSLVEIAAFQWQAAHAAIEDALREVPAAQQHRVRYDELVRRPRDVLAGIAELAGLCWDERVERAIAAPLPLTTVTLSAPAADKWRRHEHELAALLPARASAIAPRNRLGASEQPGAPQGGAGSAEWSPEGSLHAAR